MAKNEIQADLQVIVELMSRVDQNEDIERLEQTLKRDPSLAFKLLRYLNSAAFGLPVEVSSFRHAIMLLGYPRLKRWLALLLTTASKDHSMRPLMFAALRRGLLMEELAKSMSDSELRDEMFICGLFSLLDHMLKQAFAKLLQSIPSPERVRQALVDETGPYQPYLELVRAIEQASVFDYRANGRGSDAGRRRNQPVHLASLGQGRSARVNPSMLLRAVNSGAMPNNLSVLSAALALAPGPGRLARPFALDQRPGAAAE